MGASQGVKRKAPHSTTPGSFQSSSRPHKRSKLLNARTILTQPPDPAINRHGDLDVAAFVKAREFEIHALQKSMLDSKKVLSTRAFQQVPRDMRRRTASHNVKKVPKRLRARAAKEMKEDKTPTAEQRQKKISSHKRLRLEKGKELKAKGKLRTSKREAARKEKSAASTSAAQDPEQVVLDKAATNIPRAKKNTLADPPRPPSKFRRRQINKSWLPTHIWHAKRAQMTEPKAPLWRHAIALTPSEKCFRTTHRSATLRGCLVWDMSYMSTIGLEGVEASLLGALRALDVNESVLSGTNGARWRRGTRHWQGLIRERDHARSWIAPVTTVWCAQEDDESDSANSMINAEKRKTRKRKLLVRVHPSAFFQVWNELVKVSKIQRPQVVVEDLRFELGSIEITGPGSTEALIGCLRPCVVTASDIEIQETLDVESGGVPVKEDVWVDLESSATAWLQLKKLTNPAALPLNAMLAFNVSDPRLRFPPRKPESDTDLPDEEFLHLLSAWPVDQTFAPADIFDRRKRLLASRLMSSQKAINRRRSQTLPGEYPSPQSTDPKIPILLLAHRAHAQSPSKLSDRGTQGSWTLILPWSCVLPVWYSLMHLPLSTGGNPRFGCLEEHQQIALEHARPSFPEDFPGTKAGWEWELRIRAESRSAWQRKPKGRRTEYESLRLGNDSSVIGELGEGWACDWEYLCLGREAYTARRAEMLKSKEADEAASTLDLPPLDIQHVPFATVSTLAIIPTNALTPIHLVFLAKGHPTRASRIYRIPSSRTIIKNPGTEISVPNEKDLIGFITSTNYDLGHGRVHAMANILVRKVLSSDDPKGDVKRDAKICVVRKAGETVCRLAKWDWAA